MVNNQIKTTPSGRKYILKENYLTFPIIRLGVIIGCISRKYFTFIISIFKVRPLPCRL